MVFGHFGAPGLPWGPPWRPNLDFGEFGSIFGVFFDEFGFFGGFWEDFSLSEASPQLGKKRP